MSEAGEIFQVHRDFRKAKRAAFGVNCTGCAKARPKAPASILLPGQRCKEGWYGSCKWGEWYPCNAARAERMATEMQWGEPKYQVRPMPGQRANIVGDAAGGAE